MIVRQMLKKIRVEESGDSDVLPGVSMDVLDFNEMNEELIAAGKQPAEGKQVMLLSLIHISSTQGGKKKTNREKKAADPFQNMGNRMAGQRNAFEHMKSQLEQYRGQADTCQSGTYSSQSAKSIMDRVNSERGRKKPFTGILIVVIIWLVFSVGGNLLFLITHAIRESIYGIENIFDSSSGDLWSSADSNAVEVLGEGELSDEEVRAIGTNCCLLYTS